MSEPIDAQCRDPEETRHRALMAEPTPCHRCLAYLPETKSGCLFIERGQRPEPKRRPQPAEQETIW